MIGSTSPINRPYIARIQISRRSNKGTGHRVQKKISRANKAKFGYQKNKIKRHMTECGSVERVRACVSENELRWGFIRKVYCILATQLLLTTVISGVTVLYTPLNKLLSGNNALMIVLCILPIILLLPLYIYQQKHPWNFVILGLFTATLSLSVGVTYANTDGKIVLQALILTSAVVSALTCYTFWASRRGQDFSFLGPILAATLFVFVLVGFMQMFFPLGSTASAIYSAIGAILFCFYIVYDTSVLITKYTYDEYIWASVNLYLDILNLFLYILQILSKKDD